MKIGTFAAIAVCAVGISFSACGGKKKNTGAENQAPDGKTSATASYDAGNKTQPDSGKPPLPGKER